MLEYSLIARLIQLDEPISGLESHIQEQTLHKVPTTST